MRSIFSSAPLLQISVVLMLGSEDATSLGGIIPFFKRSGASIPDGLFYKAVSLTNARQVRFMVLRLETPIMYWFMMQDMKARMYQKLVLGRLSPGSRWRCW